MTSRSSTVFVSVALLLGGLTMLSANAQQVPAPVKAVQLTGLTGVKEHAKGTLSVENGHLHFIHGKESSDLNTSSMEDVVTGADTQRAIGGTLGALTMVGPYGSGRFLSLFRTKIDTLVVQFRDPDGGLHGAIFTMPLGAAEELKKQLVAQGARTTIAPDPNPAPATANNSSSKGQKQ
jgi:hypothetical protein